VQYAEAHTAVSAAATLSVTTFAQIVMWCDGIKYRNCLNPKAETSQRLSRFRPFFGDHAGGGDAVPSCLGPATSTLSMTRIPRRYQSGSSGVGQVSRIKRSSADDVLRWIGTTPEPAAPPVWSGDFDIERRDHVMWHPRDRSPEERRADEDCP
jgi:hypothetical protein